MKKITILLALVAAVFTGCKNYDPNDSNTLSTGQIEMKIYPDKNNYISFNAITQKITIDWGDGTVDDLIPNGINKNFSHEYSNRNLQTVKINTEEITGDAHNIGETTAWGINFGFTCDSCLLQELKFGNCSELKAINCSSNQLTTLDVSKCTALIFLNCDNDNLTTLDVSKCTALCYLICIGNNLSASALNALFNSLPTRKSTDYAVLYYWGNPGSATCDKTIAANKGWNIGGN